MAKNLRKYWNLWLTVLIFVIVIWFKNKNETLVEEIKTYLMFAISLIGALTFIKTNLEKGKKASYNAASIEGIRSEMEKNVAELKSEMEKQNFNFLKEKNKMEKFKKFFKWLWGNKYTLISLTISIIAVAFCNYLMWFGYLDRYTIFAEHETLLKVLGIVLSLGYLAVDIFTTVTKYGCESIEQLNTRYQAEAERKLNALSPEQKAAVKSTIKNLQTQLSLIEPKYNEALKTIESFQMLSKIDGFDTSSLVEGYNQASQYAHDNTTIIAELKKQIEVLTNKL